MATLLISDLHLDAVSPTRTALFLDFLARRARDAEALYILGDLFEVWIGDDNHSEPGKTVMAALRTLSQSATALYFLHGNRDFLIGERFAKASGCRLLPESIVIDLYGEPVLLMHGDTLCIDDVAYQAFRARVRNPVWQARVLMLPLVLRRMMAAWLRRKSRQATQKKPVEITDVNSVEVERVMRSHGVHRLIHGHTHRPAIHQWSLDGRIARRAVLGDWQDECGSVLCCDQGGWRLEPFCWWWAK
ncbi:MAG: UDP-2,3-diacylglucosamine diphosphatase [Candidatus Contendobacter odensis]|uniref:UDP-2,3-diacylglucosamine hydrolase n=1 Tax=Candidatus Contendibacter odensensis TaxID=1400860 RepID=A0A2G6PHJ2_9GAMM|nr:MAG: UDP-2,3-diacylglucosamine diphosphatase [Candidatus Contendobacter odensis]